MEIMPAECNIEIVNFYLRSRSSHMNDSSAEKKSPYDIKSKMSRFKSKL